ncbi:hypothetical protein [Blastococcus sp. SYSU D01042]
MSVFRVTMEFDLEILDEEPAKALTAEHWRTAAQAIIDEGGHIQSEGGASPEVAGRGMADHPQAVASTVAFRLLAEGAHLRPFVRVTDVEVNNEPK